MTPGATVVRRAPGKLFVAGEWAVMDPGNAAVLVAVDRYATVTAASARPAPDGADVVISSDLGVRQAPWRWDGGRLVVCGRGEEGGSRGLLAHVVSAVETVGRLLCERGLPRPALTVTVASSLHEGGRKLGLGSSGAVTAATVAAVASCCGLELPAGHRYRLALLATALIDPEASGGDLAASTFGGWIAYRAPDRAFVLDLAARAGLDEMLDAPWPGLEVRRLPPPGGLSLHTGWTGRPVSTAALLSGLGRPWRGSTAHRRFTEASNRLVDAAVAALTAGDGPGLQHQIRAARRELARLDDTAHLGIFTPELTRLCEAAEAAGGAGKPSGAGGGDCGIALLDARAAHAARLMRRRWAAAGIVPLPVRPAWEGTGT